MNYVSSAQKGVFIENLGQWENDFSFKIPLNNGGVFISPEEVVFKFTKIQKTSKEKSSHSVNPHSNTIQAGDILLGHAYRVNFLGGNSNASVKMGVKRKTYHNYILGNDRSKWKSKVGLYESFQFQEIYQNVDIDYYFNKDGNLKYDLILKPGADASQIKLQYEGTDGLDLIYGNLRVKTSVEDILESAPYAYQNIEGEIKEVKCSYVLTDSILSFSIGRYNEDYPLVIDPVLIFSSYTGSVANNFGFTATYGEGGTAYGGGIVYGSTLGRYPVSVGAFQDTLQGGTVDVAITKFLPDGTNIIYSTYLGGDQEEVPHSIIEGPDKELIILGSTGSSNFPTTLNAYDRSFEGGPSTSVNIGGQLTYPQGSDLYIVRLDSTGGVLKGATFFGGDGIDGINRHVLRNYGDDNRGGIEIDSLGNIYFVSSTTSTNLPNSGLHTASPLGDQDGIVFSMNSNLSSLNWCTYVGGQGHDALLGIRIKNNSELYIAGTTNSFDLGTPYTGGVQPIYLGNEDGFVAKVNTANGTITNFTYNGTTIRDRNFLIDLDDQGNVYVLGQTNGPYPLIGDSNNYSNVGGSQYIHQFNGDLNQTIRSTIFGDNSVNTTDISPTAFMIDRCGNVYISGWSWSNAQLSMGGTNGLPVTQNAGGIIGARSTSDNNDFYFMILDASWKKLNFATFYGEQGGSDHVDGGTSRFNKDGTVYQAVCAGCSGSDNFPTTNGAFSNDNGSGGCNLAVVKFKMELSVKVDFEPDIDSSCVPFEVNLVNRSYNADIYTITDSDGNLSQKEPKKLTINKEGNQWYKIVAIDTVCGFKDSITLNFYGIVDSLEASFESDNDSCSGELTVNFKNTSVSANSFFWSFGDGQFSLDANPSHAYDQEGTYKVDMMITSKDCINSDTSSQEVVVKTKDINGSYFADYLACRDGTSAVFKALGEGFENYVWSVNGKIKADTSIFSFDFEKAGVYMVRLESIDSVCGYYFSYEQTIEVSDKDYMISMPNVFTPNGDGFNDEFGLIEESPEDFFNEFTFKVFNRWGVELFSTSEYDDKWTGIFESKLVNEGVYYYVLNYSDICGNSSEEKGFVHLLH